MKSFLLIIVAVVCIALGFGGAEETQDVSFVSFTTGEQLFHFNVNPKIPIRLLKRIVANKVGKELRTVLLFANGMEMDDTQTLDNYKVEKEVKVLVNDDCKVDLYDFETNNLLGTLTVQPVTSVRALIFMIRKETGINEKAITLYHGQEEMKDGEDVSRYNLASDNKILVYVSN